MRRIEIRGLQVLSPAGLTANFYYLRPCLRLKALADTICEDVMSIAWSSDFSYRYFRKILEAIKDGFECHPICEAPRILRCNDGTPQLILRHDVDISLPIACRMAEMEAERG